MEEPQADSKIGPWIGATHHTPRDTRWLWWPRMPHGHLTIVAGRGGSGKGLFATDLAAKITTGDYLPCSEERAEGGRVIWCETEDSIEETMVPRMIAAGADLRNVRFLDPKGFFELAQGYAAFHGVKLIVLSPLVSCLQDIADTNKETEVRAKLTELTHALEGREISILGLMHLNKKVEMATIERILGSGAFANFSRSVLFTNSEEDSNNKRLVHEKYNLSLKANDLIYEPRATRGERDQYVAIRWKVAEENANMDALLEKRMGQQAAPVSASTWLLGYLAEHGGGAHKADIVEAGLKAGHTKRAIEGAKERSTTIKTKTNGDAHNPMWQLHGLR